MEEAWEAKAELAGGWRAWKDGALGGGGSVLGAAGHRESPMARPARLSRPLRSGHRPSPSPGPAVLEAGPRLWTDPLHWCLAS